MMVIPFGVGWNPSNMLLPNALAVLSSVFKSANFTPMIVRLSLSIAMGWYMFFTFPLKTNLQ